MPRFYILRLNHTQLWITLINASCLSTPASQSFIARSSNCLTRLVAFPVSMLFSPKYSRLSFSNSLFLLRSPHYRGAVFQQSFVHRPSVAKVPVHTSVCWKENSLIPSGRHGWPPASTSRCSLQIIYSLNKHLNFTTLVCCHVFGFPQPRVVTPWPISPLDDMLIDVVKLVILSNWQTSVLFHLFW